MIPFGLRRRTPLRAKPRRNRPPVDWDDLRRRVLDRDRVCFMYRLDPSHRCFDQWGRQHEPDDRSRLTLDHVKVKPRLGRKADDVADQLVAMCFRENDRPPSKATRIAERAYLDALAEPEHPHVEIVHGCQECDRIRDRRAAS